MQFNATTTSAVRTLTDLPNISFLLGEDLAKLGITTPQRLIEVGAERVWDRLHAAGLHADAHVLLALEGAIMRLPWQSIPAERRL